MTETKFKQKVKKFLDSIEAYHVPYAASMYTINGTPDILACINGRFVGIEVKASNGKPTELQLHKIEEIKAAGGIALVLYPEGFEDFKKLCKQIKGGIFNEINKT